MVDHEAEIVSVRNSAAIQSLLPYLESEVAGMQQAALNRAFTQLRKGTLTPDQAYNILSELHSYQTLLGRLGSRVRLGQSIGTRIAPIMSIEGDENGE